MIHGDLFRRLRPPRPSWNGAETVRIPTSLAIRRDLHHHQACGTPECVSLSTTLEGVVDRTPGPHPWRRCIRPLKEQEFYDRSRPFWTCKRGLYQLPMIRTHGPSPGARAT